MINTPSTSRTLLARTLGRNARRRVSGRPLDRSQSVTVPAESTEMAESFDCRVMHVMSAGAASAVGFVFAVVNWMDSVESPPTCQNLIFLSLWAEMMEEEYRREEIFPPSETRVSMGYVFVRFVSQTYMVASDTPVTYSPLGEKQQRLKS